MSPNNFIDDVREGLWDNELAELQEAVNERKEAKRAALQAEIEKLFGAGATIQLPGEYKSAPQPAEQPIELVSAGSGDSVIVTADPDSEEEIPMPASEHPEEDDFESHSPIIGPANPS